MKDFDLVCVGAGPYGISLYAHAVSTGMRVGVFGRPFSFWRENIPPGFVIGTGADTNISVPAYGCNLEDYLRATAVGSKAHLFVTREVFLGYCDWLMAKLKPPINKKMVIEVTLKSQRRRIRASA